jgi:hypothetical protein
MSWLPRIYTCGSLSCDEDHDYEGREISVVWGRYMFSISLAKREDADAR